MTVEENTPITSEVAPEAVEQTEVQEGGAEEQVQSVVEPAMYELPDGKKVDAQTLSKEWKENFLPEFTRRSQRLAALETQKPQEQEPAWKKEGWEPQSYQELLAAAKEEAKRDVFAELQKEVEQEERERQHYAEQVQREVDELKQIDPNVDENRVIAHAAKYEFPSLKSAYKNWSEMSRIQQLAEERAVKNMKARSTEPIAVTTQTSPSALSIPKGLSPREAAQYALRQMKS